MLRRSGFTLIELLIVIVIIGILAAIAIPKFAKTREKAFMRAVVSDLRNLHAQEEIYYTGNAFSYTNSLADMPYFHTSDGVTITITEAHTMGWSVTATHAALPAWQICGLYVGTVAARPSFAPTADGVHCTGE